MAKIFVPVGHSLLVAKLNRVMYQGKKQKSQNRKMVSGTRCPCVSVCECDGERGSGPEGADDLCSVSLEA